MKLKMGHKVFAYLIILSATLALFSGIQHYRLKPKHYTAAPLEWFHVMLMVFLFIAAEIAWRMIFLYEGEYVGDKKDLVLIPIEKFNSRVQAGEKLVILDDLVLDIDKYMWDHPGGTFALK